MRVEIREPKSSDVRASVDPALPAGEIRRSRRRAARRLVRSARRGRPPHRRVTGRARASQRRRDDRMAAADCRAGAGDRRRDRVRRIRPRLVQARLRRAAGADTRARRARRVRTTLANRQATVARHIDAARNLANRPPNDLTPPALAAYAQGLEHPHLAVEAHGRDWIESNGPRRARRRRAGRARTIRS